MSGIETARVTRESWLEALIDVWRPKFRELEYPLPNVIHVSVGFPYGVAPENKVILAQCLHSSVSKDGHNHVYISPVVDDPAEAARCLLHELVHVVLDNEDGHRGRFAEIAKALGFVGKMTQTPVGDSLGLELVMVTAELGPFPHSAVDLAMLRPAPVPVPVGGAPARPKPRVTSGPVPQRNRYFKVVCENPQCDGYGEYGGNFTRKWIEAGLPDCGMCHAPMALTAPLPE